MTLLPLQSRQEPIMPERKNTDFDRPGGYAMPKGAALIQRRAARDEARADAWRLPRAGQVGIQHGRLHDAGHDWPRL